ncbi:MAG: hypothetical protein IJ417_01155 [Bacteroidaceae bacterium]|nr:hypothetical protein [Bacteroidaceae bacterium]
MNKTVSLPKNINIDEKNKELLLGVKGVSALLGVKGVKANSVAVLYKEIKGDRWR